MKTTTRRRPDPYGRTVTEPGAPDPLPDPTPDDAAPGGPAPDPGAGDTAHGGPTPDPTADGTADGAPATGPTPAGTGHLAPAAPDASPRAVLPRRRRVVARAVLALAVLVALAAVALAGVADDLVVVLGVVVAGRRTLLVVMVVCLLVVAAAHVAQRRPGPPGAGELALLVGVVVGTLAPLLLLGVPMLGFVVLMGTLLLALVLATPGPLTAAAAVLVVGAVVVRLGARHRLLRATGAVLVACGTTALGVVGVGFGMTGVADTVVVARDHAGCTAVVRQGSVSLFTGEAVLYVAGPGSSLALRRDAFTLEETYPFSTSDHVLDAGAQDVRIAFDDGLGGVDRTYGCT